MTSIRVALVEDDDLIRTLDAMSYSVRTYIKGIYRKLQVRSRLQLLSRAVRGDL